MHDNEFETKEKKIWTKGKIEAQHKQQIWISWWRDFIFSLFAVIEKYSFYTRNNVPYFFAQPWIRSCLLDVWQHKDGKSISRPTEKQSSLVDLSDEINEIEIE